MYPDFFDISRNFNNIADHFDDLSTPSAAAIHLHGEKGRPIKRRRRYARRDPEIQTCFAWEMDEELDSPLFLENMTLNQVPMPEKEVLSKFEAESSTNFPEGDARPSKKRRASDELDDRENTKFREFVLPIRELESRTPKKLKNMTPKAFIPKSEHSSAFEMLFDFQMETDPPQSTFIKSSNKESAYYEYEPLPDSEIRLIRLFPRRDHRNMICCELVHIDLRTKPLYLALSYVWGEGTKKRTIVLNGKWFKVTQNLFDALNKMQKFTDELDRFVGLADNDEWTTLDDGFVLEASAPPNLPEVELFFWVDEISINQEDINEKSRNVSKMADIYSSAHATLVSMQVFSRAIPEKINRFINGIVKLTATDGFTEDKMGSEVFFTEMRKRNNSISEELILEMLQMACNFLSDEWFQRVQALQGLILSHRPAVVAFRSGVSLTLMGELLAGARTLVYLISRGLFQSISIWSSPDSLGQINSWTDQLAQHLSSITTNSLGSEY